MLVHQVIFIKSDVTIVCIWSIDGHYCQKKTYDSTFIILIMVGLAVLIGDGKLNYATLALLQKCPMNFVLAKYWTLGLWWFVMAKRK